MINKIMTLIGTEGRKSSGDHKAVTGTDIGKKRALDVAIRSPLTAFGEIWLNRNDVLTVAVKATSGTTDVTTYINWQED